MNIDDVLARFRAKKGLRFDNQVAEMIGLSPSNFGNKKKRGTLLEVLLDYAQKDGMDIDWLLSGAGESEENLHSDPIVNKILAEIVDLEGIDQPIKLTKKEAMAVILLRELSEFGVLTAKGWQYAKYRQGGRCYDGIGLNPLL